jgi:spore coat polysaccharide biosynthesis protein SpsF
MKSSKQSNYQKKIVAIIEARMTSTRLPGKHMLLVNGKPIIGHLINRLKSVTLIDEIVMATTSNDSDDMLVELSEKMGISYYRGSEEDVMERVLFAATFFGADTIVGITGDCPVIDPLLIEQTIQTFICNDCDYVDNMQNPGYPGGMNTTVYKLESLKKSRNLTNSKLDFEHVTSHISRNPQLFRHIYLVPPKDLYWPELKLELDEKLDYDLLKKIIEYFGDENQLFSCREIIELLRSKVEWANINKDVYRKGYE